MDRKEFMKKSGCGLLCFSAAPLLMGASTLPEKGEAPQRKRFSIDIDIFEAREDTWCHKKGDKFSYPGDIGKLCPWLLSSMQDFLRLMENDVTLGWKYEGTPYEKLINENGVTTEFVRCPDPTSDLVARITRSEVTG
ncbi:MAG: hypothetical protein E4G95_00365 [Bacteroidia bacterium]|nr:MAG: hypothetical protein E4G95_00365 [Bacteroidia bacterium]